MKLKWLLFIVAALVFLLAVFIYKDMKKTPPSRASFEYVAIGDSYTIGFGVEEEDRWPNVMTKHLKAKGMTVELVANPAVSGFTVRDAIEVEIPVVKGIKPDFVTVLIGANDNFMQRSQKDFQEDLVELLDRLQQILTNPKNIVLVTISDYSKSPSAQGSKDSNLSEFIKSYNEIIKDEAGRRGLPVADIFPVSQTMTGSDDYVLDGLHPSAQGYRRWEEIILPVVYNLIRFK